MWVPRWLCSGLNGPADWDRPTFSQVISVLQWQPKVKLPNLGNFWAKQSKVFLSTPHKVQTFTTRGKHKAACAHTPQHVCCPWDDGAAHKQGVGVLKVRHSTSIHPAQRSCAGWKLVTSNYNYRAKCKNNDRFSFQLKKASADFRGVLRSASLLKWEQHFAHAEKQDHVFRTKPCRMQRIPMYLHFHIQVKNKLKKVLSSTQMSSV